MVNNTQYLTGGKSPNPLEPPSNFLASPGNAKVTLTWTDPPNATVEPSGQTYATWAYTQVVRKEGSQPTGPNDGTVVVQSSVRDQYATNGFVDTGLTNDTLYYYGAFAYNSDGVYSEGAFVSATPMAGTPLSELTEGTLITINENGSPVEFYVAKRGYEPDLNGTDRTLVVRKDCYNNVVWHNRDSDVSFINSTLCSYLNTTYKSNFSKTVQNLMSETSIYFGMGNYNTIEVGQVSIFILSYVELGLPSQSSGVFIYEGTKLPISDLLTIGYYQGGAVNRWTRSRCANYADNVAWYTMSSGKPQLGYINAGSIKGYNQPCFTLPSTAMVDFNLALIETA